MDNLYKKIVDTVPVFFFLWSRDKKETIFLSGKFYDQKSKDYYAPEEPPADLRQYIHPESQSEYDRFFANLSAENDYSDDVEVRAGEALPNIKWLKISTFPVIEEGKKIESIAGHIADVTNSRESNQVLLEQVESLDTVTFMLAHELSSPIANIMGLAELLKSRVAKAGLDEDLHFYDSIYNFGGEILTLAQGLVNLLDLQSGKNKFILEEIRLKPFIKKRLKNFYLKPDSAKIRISCSDMAENASAWIQPTNFAKAIEEILVYLIKHIQPNNQISISTLPNPRLDHTILRIYSAGVSLPKESIQQILDRSSRLGLLDVAGRKIRGLLELVVAKEIIELHQGRLELLDEGEVKGFLISIPPLPDSPAD